jgi:hypothetical protein
MPPPFDRRDVRAVAAALAPSAHPEALGWQKRKPAALLAVARHWQVTPPLWRSLRAQSGLDPSLAHELRQDYWENVRANAHWTRAAEEIVGRLNRLGVEPLLLKGAGQLFDPPGGHAGTRYLVDLDLLVPIGRDEACQEALIAAGFSAAEAWDSPGHHHWPKLRRSSEDGLPPVVVEIHRYPRFGGNLRETREFLADSVAHAVPGGRCRLLSTTHRLLLNAVHALGPCEGGLHWAVLRAERHDAIEQVNLRQLLDFAELATLRHDSFRWPDLLASADRMGVRWDLQQWAYLARTLMASPVPPAVARWYTARPDWRTPRQLIFRAGRAGLRACGLLTPLRRLRRERTARRAANP